MKKTKSIPLGSEWMDKYGNRWRANFFLPDDLVDLESLSGLPPTVATKDSFFIRNKQLYVVIDENMMGVLKMAELKNDGFLVEVVLCIQRDFKSKATGEQKTGFICSVVIPNKGIGEVFATRSYARGDFMMLELDIDKDKRITLRPSRDS